MTADAKVESAWTGRVLAMAFAFFAGCPVMANLVSTFVADGQSFAVTATIACTVLLLAGLAAARLGLPAHPITSLRHPLLALVIIGGLFWTQWLLLNLLSPSPQPLMHYQIFQAAIWLLLPMALFVFWRRWLDPHLVIRFLIVLYLLFVIGLSLRWALGLGLNQGGRWHAGHSLEAVRCGRYAAMSLWVFALAALCPAAVIPARLKVAALVCMPLAVLMMVAANSRGPWLALMVTILAACIPLARVLAVRIGRDVRVLAILLLAVAGITAFVAWQVGSVESNYQRLTSLHSDGGSAVERMNLLHDHLQLLVDTPLALLSGSGYGHGYFYPHNVLVEALANGGLLLFALLLAMLGVTIHAWLTRCRADDVPALIIVGLFILSFASNQVSGSIATDLTWYFPLLLALTIARYGRRPTAPEPAAVPAIPRGALTEPALSPGMRS